MRGLIALLLSLTLGLSLAGHGAVRLVAASGTQAVLCTGSGAVTVTLGRDGQPLATPHPHCPDCLPLPALEPAAAPAPAAPRRTATRISTPPGGHIATAHLPRHPPARGPPPPPVA